MNKPTILVIDDESQIQKLLKITLESNGYIVAQAHNAREGLYLSATHPPDLVILDLGLPDENGHAVLQKLRQWYTHPIIILSVQQNEEDIVLALDKGADDYLVKPFRTGELLARIRSVLRKSVSDDNGAIVKSELLEIDLIARTVKRRGELLKLTATEYNLLSVLARNEGKVLTHQYLLNEVWGPAYLNQSQYLRVFVAQIRKKIENDPNRPEIIVTESGVGYRFINKDD